jgi:hypothetical protein
VPQQGCKRVEWGRWCGIFGQPCRELLLKHVWRLCRRELVEGRLGVALHTTR